MAAFQYRVTHLRTFRNNRRYNEGEIIDSDMVIVSRGMAPNNEATRIAVEQKRSDIAKARAQTPEQMLSRISDLEQQLLKYREKDLAAELAKREAEEKAEEKAKAPPIPPATPAPTQQQSRRADR